MIRLFEDAAEGITHKGRAPEFQTGPARALVSDSVRGGHIDAVRQGVGALNQFPSFMLRLAEFGFLARMPAGGGGIEENVGALESGEPGRFRIPLIPADEHT